MEIKNGVLESISQQDIKGGKVIIPDGITKIGLSVFCRYYGLYEVIIPDSVIEIEEEAFHDCYDLKKVKLPKNLKKISKRTFQYDKNLEEVIFPEGLEIIDFDAFEGCHRLKKIKLPDSVTKIKNGAFSYCKNLEEVIFPADLEILEEMSFSDCPIKKVILPEKLRVIDSYALEYSKIEEITLPPHLSRMNLNNYGLMRKLRRINTKWGSYEINLEKPIHQSQMTDIYLYLHINHIVKEKYQSIEELEENRYIKDFLENCQSKNLDVFMDIFYKTRKSYDVPFEVLTMVKEPKEFSYSVWNRIRDVFPYQYSETMRVALARMIEVFGLFKKDKNQEKRIQSFLSLFDLKEYVLTNPQYEEIIRDGSFMEKHFEKGYVDYFYRKDLYDMVPEEFSSYLTGSLTPEKMKKIKKMSGTYGKRLNDYIRENYNRETVEIYRVKEEYLKDASLRSYLFNCDFHGKFNHQSAHRIFDEQVVAFNEDYYKFFMENLPFILSNSMIQSDLKTIEKNFSEIKEFYLRKSGVEIPSLAQAKDYIDGTKLKFEKGNLEFMEEASAAGVKDQDIFNFYQEIYNRNKERRKTSLVKRSNIYEIDGFTIKTELLRKDDGFSLLVGEKNYTNCCQVYGGAGHNCMAHATNSEDGGIFVTKILLNGEWILLTQSWDWQNNNLYCHDNIEGTEFLKNGSQELKKAVAEAFRLDAEYIIDKSKNEVEKYIKERKKRIENSLCYDKDSELQKLTELEKNQVIKVVTSGTGYDDLGLKNFFSSSFYADEEQFLDGKRFTLENFQPVDYNPNAPYFDSSHSAYSDAKGTQYIMAGSLEELVFSKNEPLVPIYRDERRIFQEKGEDLRDYTIERISSIEEKAYPKEMQTHQWENKISFRANEVYLGEDWYLIYEIRNDNSIYISDLARKEPLLEDEKGKQLQEMMNTIYELVKTYDKVEADLKEDTSYLLYLLNKRLGYIEQIGEDISYPYEDDFNKKVVSEEEQSKLLKDIRNIKNQENKKIIMHKVIFKRGKKLETEVGKSK